MSVPLKKYEGTTHTHTHTHTHIYIYIYILQIKLSHRMFRLYNYMFILYTETSEIFKIFYKINLNDFYA